MKLREVICNVPGVRCPEIFENEITERICTDPAKACRGSLYIDLESENRNTLQNAYAAFKKGATVLSGKKKESLSFPFVSCDYARSAYSYVASSFYGNPCKRLKTVAVTGTNGKTTVTTLISFLLNGIGVKTGAIGTLGVFSGGVRVDEALLPQGPESMTTPDPDRFFAALDLMERDGCKAVVTEASSHSLALSKLDAFRADVSVFTNLTEDHLDFHTDMKQYFEAKSKIVDLSDIAVVNADDEWASGLIKNDNTVGISASGVNGKKIYAYADNISFKGLSGLEYTAYIDGRKIYVKTPMFAEYAVFNTLSALAVISLLGEDVKSASELIPQFKGAVGRCEAVVMKKGLPTVLLDYAHTPDALLKTLSSVRKAMKSGRLISVFGCGGNRDRAKRALMGMTASKHADFSVLTEDNSRNEETRDIISEIEKGFERPNYCICCDREEAINEAVGMANPEDVVAVCGKGHENYIIDKCGKRYYSDRKSILKAVYGKYGNDCLNDE